MELNVFFTFRKKYIGSKLLKIAKEKTAKLSDKLRLLVGLYQGYGNAKKLYVKSGLFTRWP